MDLSGTYDLVDNLQIDLEILALELRHPPSHIIRWEILRASEPTRQHPSP